MSSSISEYSGFKGYTKETSVDRLKAAETTAEGFFVSHVATRTPALFVDQITDAACSVSGLNLWSNSYLKKKCGDCQIKIETREEGGTYGKGNEVKTTFGEFLKHVSDGRTYLTTQDLVYDEDGRPAIVSPPLTSLQSDYPLTPSLFDSLVVNNINMWFGDTKQYSTSGLHHDFHDNLYVLLRGEKRFTLISPAEAHNLYTVGTISQVHPNGRINYVGQLPTRADGSDIRAEAAFLASHKLQRVAERLAQTEEGEEDLEDELDAALDEVLDAEMDGEEEEDDDFEGSDYSNSDEEDAMGSGNDEEGEGGDDGSRRDRKGQKSGVDEVVGSRVDGDSSGSDSEGDWEGGDDYVDSDAENTDYMGNGESADESSSSDSENSENSDSDNSNSDSESNGEGKTAVNSNDKNNHKRKRVRPDLGLLGKGLRAALTASKRDNRNNNSKNKKQRTSTTTATTTATIDTKTPASSLPDNFSQVDTSLTDEELKVRYPLYYAVKQRGAAIEVVLKAGQMLYIPAGWFHEVHSRGSGDSSDSSGGTGGSNGGESNTASALTATTSTATASSSEAATAEYNGHLALNYWFHPPDGSTYNQPYTSDFWRRDMEERMK